MSLQEKIKDAGIDNILFLVPMKPVRSLLWIHYTSSDDEEVLVPAKICESRYKVSEGYKITLKSIYPRFGKESFYISDLTLLIKNGTVQIFNSMK